MNVAKSVTHRLFHKLAGGIVAAFFAAQVILAVPHFQSAVEPLRSVPNLSYADKMRIQWGGTFELLDFIRRETPENAAILMKEDGRPEFDQYFLFPRRVIYGDADALHRDPQIEYVLITDGYPQFTVRGEKKMMDAAHGLYKVQR